jgi:hypothetical protein
MKLEQEHCRTILDVLKNMENVTVSGPLVEIRAFARRIDECKNAVHSYSDALYPDTDRAGAEMLSRFNELP